MQQIEQLREESVPARRPDSPVELESALAGTFWLSKAACNLASGQRL